jgi:hypothetical protein
LRPGWPIHRLENVCSKITNFAVLPNIAMADASECLVQHIKVFQEHQDCTVGTLRLRLRDLSFFRNLTNLNPGAKCASLAALSVQGLFDGHIMVKQRLIGSARPILTIDHDPESDLFGLQSFLLGDLLSKVSRPKNMVCLGSCGIAGIRVGTC